MILTARYSIDQYPDRSDGLSSGLREALKAAVKGLERLPPEDLLSRSPAIAQCNRAYGRIREPERGRRADRWRFVGLASSTDGAPGRCRAPVRDRDHGDQRTSQSPGIRQRAPFEHRNVHMRPTKILSIACVQVRGLLRVRRQGLEPRTRGLRGQSSPVRYTTTCGSTSLQGCAVGYSCAERLQVLDTDMDTWSIVDRDPGRILLHLRRSPGAG